MNRRYLLLLSPPMPYHLPIPFMHYYPAGRHERRALIWPTIISRR